MRKRGVYLLLSIITTSFLLMGCNTKNVYTKFSPKEGKEFNLDYSMDVDFIVDDEEEGLVNKFDYDIDLDGTYKFETVNEKEIISKLKYKDITINYNVDDVFSFKINKNSIKNMEYYNYIVNSESTIETDTDGNLLRFDFQGKDSMIQDSILENVDFESIIDIITMGIALFDNQTLVEDTKLNIDTDFIKEFLGEFSDEEMEIDDESVNIEVSQVTDKIGVLNITMKDVEKGDIVYNLDIEAIADLDENFGTEFHCVLKEENTTLPDIANGSKGEFILKLNYKFIEK